MKYPKHERKANLIYSRKTSGLSKQIFFRRNLKSAKFALLPLILIFAALIYSTIISAQENSENSANFEPTTVFRVNNLADTNDGACTTAAGGCTLREAIIAANNNPGLDEIAFSITGTNRTINVGSGGLPVITSPISLNGLVNGSKIELNGAGAGAGANGFHTTNGGNEITNFIINRFDGSGILVETIGGLHIWNCIIGLNGAGNEAAGNGFGIRLVHARDVTISKNVISGNRQDGIFIDGTAATNNKIALNYIGTNADSSAVLGNGANGVVIRDGSNNTIGASDNVPELPPSNVISGNGTNGVAILGTWAAGNIILGNAIGVNYSMNADFGNANHGVYVLGGAHDTFIGKLDDFNNNPYGNVISGNGADGIRIEGAGTNYSQIVKNTIGLGAGDVVIGNGNDGIFIAGGSSNNEIGNPTFGVGNIISGNTVDGVRIDGSATTGNKLHDNIIGLNSNKTAARPNGFNGVVIVGSPNNQIGRTVSFGGPTDFIGGNGTNGIAISGSTATGNVIVNSVIGGAGGLGNTQNGIVVTNGASNNIIGNDFAPSQNFITGNGGDGIFISAGTGNNIKMNSISGNGGLGIDLGADGVNANDAGDADTGANNLQNFPVLASALLRNASSRLILSGTFNSVASRTYNFQFFISDTCDASGYGEGLTAINDEQQVTTNVSGNANFNFSLFADSSVTAGKFVTAVATDPSGNSSEFSQCRQIVTEPAGSLQFSSAAYSVNESGANVTLTVTRAGGANGTVSANYTTLNGTASAGQDYAATSDIVDFLTDETSRTITIPVNEDTLDEANETFSVALSNPVGGATLGSPNPAVVTITDNDTAGTLQFSAAAYSVTENGVTATITVTRTGGAASGVSVNYSTSNGTATAGADYTATSGTLTFGESETSKTFSVPITNDTLDEANETVNLSLSNPTGGGSLGNPSAAVLTITDNDAAPTLSINNVSVTEGNSSTVNATFSVTLSAASGQTISVNWATANGTATAPGDYTAGNGALTFDAGQTSKQIVIAVNGDTVVEPNETFSVNLSNASNAPIADGLGTGTITNDDSGGSLQFSASTASVGEGAGSVTLTVTRTGGAASGVTVNYASANGTATAGQDYTATSGSLTFAANETSKTISIPILNDAIVEGNETFTVSLNSPSGGATLGTPAAITVTITDNDSCNYSINPTSRNVQASGGSGSVTVTVLSGCNWVATSNAIWITISGGNSGSGNGTVNYAVAANTSTSQRTGTLTIAGQIFTVTQAGAMPTRRTVADFDGDGKTDISIFRPSVGEWWYLKSSNGGNFAAQFGNSSDKLVPGDFTGDGHVDIAIWRPSSGEWFILRSEDGSYFSLPFGTNGDIPVVGDFDGDGKADQAVFRPSNTNWYIRRSTDGSFTTQQFGAGGDVPVVADYDADGKADVAIYRPSNGQWWIQRSTAGLIAYTLGNSADKPVQGDYTGDGKADVTIWRPSTGEWFILRSEDSSYYSVPFGTSGDIPSPGDYDGDRKSDYAVFRPSNSTWYVQRSTAGTLIQTFGQNGDMPVPNAFVP